MRFYGKIKHESSVGLGNTKLLWDKLALFEHFSA
jgi:hypothetical protein